MLSIVWKYFNKVSSNRSHSKATCFNGLRNFFISGGEKPSSLCEKKINTYSISSALGSNVIEYAGLNMINRILHIFFPAKSLFSLSPVHNIMAEVSRKTRNTTKVGVYIKFIFGPKYKHGSWTYNELGTATIQHLH